MHRLQDSGRDSGKANRLNRTKLSLPANPTFPKDSKQPSYRGRFAPSPTGPLHLGSLYTALASYLEARSRDGLWRVRIDDIDTPRTVSGAADEILSTLEHFGLHWDGEIVFQSRNLEPYRQAVKILQDKGLLYPCDCSRKRLGEIFSNHAEPIYPGFCRNGRVPPKPPYALRLRTDNRQVALVDTLHGLFKQDFAKEVGDFIVLRRDGSYAYHLATVVDDALTGVTDILRGADLLPSTPRQILLQELLDLPTPRYLHIPVIVDHTGAKLSKQTGATAVPRDKPGWVLFQLLQLLQQSPPKELMTAPAAEILSWAIDAWDINRIRSARQHTIELQF